MPRRSAGTEKRPLPTTRIWLPALLVTIGICSADLVGARGAVALSLLGAASILVLVATLVSAAAQRVPSPTRTPTAKPRRFAIGISCAFFVLYATPATVDDSELPAWSGAAIVAFALITWELTSRVLAPVLHGDDDEGEEALGGSWALWAVGLTALTSWMLWSEGALYAVRPGTAGLHLSLLFGSWAATLTALLFLGEPWSEPTPRAVAVLSAGLGITLWVADRFALVGLYPATHLWLSILAAICLLRSALAAVDGWQPASWRLVSITSATAVLALAAGFVGTAGGLSDPQVRVGIARTPLGSDVLWLRGQLRTPVATAPAGDHADNSAAEFAMPTAQPAGPTLPESLNILLITVDALRADAVKTSDSIDIVAPHLQALARDSVHFERAYAQGSRTAISMGSLMLGRYSANIDWDLYSYEGGRIQGPVDPASRRGLQSIYTTLPRFEPGSTLAERLAEVGFQTIGVPYAGDNEFFRQGLGFSRGFQVYRDLSLTKWPLPSSGRVTEVALRAIDQASRRWFVWVHYYDTHLSRHTRSDYDRVLSHFDRGLGQLVDGLEHRGILNDTLIVLTSDHGEALGEHRSRGHATTLYEEQIRVPLIVRFPGAEPRLVREPVALVDVAATLCTATGARAEGLNGEDLWPTITDGTAPPERPIFSELHRYRSRFGDQTADLKAVVVGDWKLIWDRQRETQELFDLRADHREEKALEEQPEARRTLLRELRKLTRTVVSEPP